MKLLLDENLSRRIIPLINQNYPGSSQVALEHLEQATDLEIWKFAKQHEFIILTRDSDFYELSLVRDAPPQIIWLKIGNCSKQEIADLLINKKDVIYNLLGQGYKCIELY